MLACVNLAPFSKDKRFKKIQSHEDKRWRWEYKWHWTRKRNTGYRQNVGIEATGGKRKWGEMTAFEVNINLIITD